MAEPGSLDDTGDLSPHSLSQGHGYSQHIGSMDVMDEMIIGGISTSPQRISNLDRSSSSLDNLAPIFPPQNFEVPDISFSNSVNSNAHFNQSMLTSAQMYGNSPALYTSVSAHGVAGEQLTASSHHRSGVSGQQMTHGSPQQTGFFPSVSRSSPCSSSSEDSDDLPLAQLAKRVANANSSHSNTSLASPSAILTDTTSMEGSPVSGVTPKKGKQTKRKKKKDPNEPQKPVSAYALFFRDTQATIKGHNPSASFGEVSKIVASMWDQLDPEHKDVYKKKTETAKKQYLKQLAAYRASQVSQSASEDIEKSPSPPAVGGIPIGSGPMSGSTNFQSVGLAPPPGSNIPVTMASQMMAQHGPHIQQQSPPHMMQVPPQMQQHMHQQHLLQQEQVNMSQAMQSSPPHQHSPTQEMSGPAYTSPPHMAQMGPASYQPNMMNHNNAFGYSEQEVNMDLSYPHCVRNGCKNHARDNPAWDSEYCSNDCVITHCRDIFKTWVASRSGSSTYPVK